MGSNIFWLQFTFSTSQNDICQRLRSNVQKHDKTKQPEKVGSDKGTQFKGEIKTFCEYKTIHLFTTENETKFAFAERFIRSLKNFI